MKRKFILWSCVLLLMGTWMGCDRDKNDTACTAGNGNDQW